MNIITNNLNLFNLDFTDECIINIIPDNNAEYKYTIDDVKDIDVKNSKGLILLNLLTKSVSLAIVSIFFYYIL